MASTPASTVPDRMVLADLRGAVLSVDEVLAAVADPSCGGVCVFVGMVRDHDAGRGVRSLDYSAHPSASQQLHAAADAVAARHPGVRLAAVHRVGTLEVGDLAVVVAAAAGHREQAFAAARDLIDTVKASVPVWKHQRFDDGGTQWVGMP